MGLEIYLQDTTVLAGTSLTTSVSSLILSINGQNFRVPLLPI